MKKQIIAIALALSFTPAVPTRAQVVESLVGGSACVASVGCGVIVGTVIVGGIAFYVLNHNGRKFRARPGELYEIHSQPMPQAGPRPEPPGAVYSRGGREESGHYAETGRLVTNYDGCRDMEKRFRKGGFKLNLIRVEPHRAPGSYYGWWCVFGGDSREVGRFNKHWR